MKISFLIASKDKRVNVSCLVQIMELIYFFIHVYQYPVTLLQL